MDDHEWLKFGDLTMARFAFSGLCAATIFADRVRQMRAGDYEALLAQLDDPAIVQWVRRTREEQALVLQT